MTDRAMNPIEDADAAVAASTQEVFDPPYEAYMMRVRGASWRVVAKKCGYSSEVSASVAVKSYLQHSTSIAAKERKAEVLQMEVDRLDQLQNAWWDAAMKGDDKAAGIVLRTMSQRSKLLGLEVESKESTGSRTILVMGNNKDYSKTLKEIVDGKHVETENPDS